MATTPEGKVKKAVKDVLNKYVVQGDCDYFMPVQTGYGDRHLDFIVCFCGFFVTIETKAPGKPLKPLQVERIRRVKRAAGYAIVVGGTSQTHTVEQLDEFLSGIHGGFTRRLER